jgi:hypothetical protein
MYGSVRVKFPRLTRLDKARRWETYLIEESIITKL